MEKNSLEEKRSVRGPAAVLVSIKFAHSADPRACGGKFRLKSRLKTQVELLSLNLKSLVRDPKPFKTDRFLAFPYIFKSAGAESIGMAPHGGGGRVIPSNGRVIPCNIEEREGNPL